MRSTSKFRLSALYVIFITALLAIFAFTSCTSAVGQTGKKPMGTVTIDGTKVPDTTKVYTGARGGKFYFKLSAKTGKVYKHYLKTK